MIPQIPEGQITISFFFFQTQNSLLKGTFQSSPFSWLQFSWMKLNWRSHSRSTPTALQQVIIIQSTEPDWSQTALNPLKYVRCWSCKRNVFLYKSPLNRPHYLLHSKAVLHKGQKRGCCWAQRKGQVGHDSQSSIHKRADYSLIL